MASHNKEKWPQEAKVSLLLIFSQLNYKKKGCIWLLKKYFYSEITTMDDQTR